MSVTTSLFLSNRTQAVRLPKAVAFDASVTEVEIAVVGEARIIRPAGSRVEVFWSSPIHISDDFARDQPAELTERTWG
ncbi:type II toxin-antitoxin system VapB family antitoxin [Nocardioides sp. R-C-SC26]|uniref:type II toxin-antitoxin system VapB family antitoxin n=1 Tax=Nocardioides sp. R-C-SC26 TaxID=2870414 RepID=UPI001E4E3674|nr:type II toxin-antitoxin system VapB family antitoxin [Nocardioides sp. R-C-SC26]